MLRSSLAAKVLAAVAAVSAVAASGAAGSPMDHMLQYQKAHLERQKNLHQNIVTKVQSDEGQGEKEPRFFSDKTKGMCMLR